MGGVQEGPQACRATALASI